MSITNYSELQTAVENWLHRSDLTSRIPEFITLFESRWNRTRRSSHQITRTTASLTAGDAYLSLPSDMLALKVIQLSTNPVQPLNVVTPAFIDQRYESDTRDIPHAVAVLGDSFQFAPTPDSNYTVEYSYYAKLSALTDANTTNWLLTLFPDIYLYGALFEAMPYIMNDQRAAAIKGLLDQKMMEFDEYEEDRVYGLQSLRMQAR